ncbi:MAG: AAA family ATPase [Candidatus Thorarchaeota archaeon]
MKLPLGVPCVDNLLGGGFETGRFTQIYGEAAAGKTTLALIAASAAHKEGLDVLFINAEAGSPIERLEQIAETSFSHLSDTIHVLTPKTFEEQGILLEDAEIFMRKNTRLIIVDTLTRLYRASLEGKKRNYEAHRELNRQAGILKGLARHHDAIVLVLNQVRAHMGGQYNEFEPVARNIMEYWSDITLKISIGQKRGERTIELMTNGYSSAPCQLALTMGGFTEGLQYKKQ